jgi:hypothetical protein
MKKNVSKLQISGSIMKILSLTIMLAFIAPVMTNAQAGKANFAGNWTYSAEKSTPPPSGGGGGQRGGGNFVAKQEANLLTTERTRPGQNGAEPTVTITKYTLDGKECVNTTPRGDSKSTATWSADGKKLTIVTNSSFTGQDGTPRPMTATAVWSLTDAKTLSIVTSRPGQDGAMTSTTAVYEIK